MNTLTIAVLIACATMAYASAIPGIEKSAPAVAAQPADAAEIFVAEENRHGGGHYGHGGYGYGGYGGYGYGYGGHGHGGHGHGGHGHGRYYGK